MLCCCFNPIQRPCLHIHSILHQMGLQQALEHILVYLCQPVTMFTLLPKDVIFTGPILQITRDHYGVFTG